jgi:hypothetical protein
MEETAIQVPYSGCSDRSLVSKAKKAAMLFLVLLPFQKFPETVWAGRFPEGVDYHSIMPFHIMALRYLDEVAIFLFSAVLLTFLLLSPGRYRVKRLPFVAYIACFVVITGAELLINRVSPLQGVFATYDYIKNFIVLCLFSWLSFTEDDFKDILALLRRITLVLALFGIAGEAAAMMFESGIGLLVADDQRFGLYRVISLTGAGNWNYLGVYAALIFFLTYITDRKRFMNYLELFLIGSLIVLTFSRQTWIIFGVLFLLLGKRRTVVIASVAMVYVAIGLAPHFSEIAELANFRTSFDPDEYFRLYAFYEATSLFFDNPILGVGPGMFGNLASVIFDSPIYDYWPAYFRNFAVQTRGIDQFWPALWADTGIAGTLAFALIFAGIYAALYRASRIYERLGNRGMVRMGRALSFFLIGLGIMGLFGGLNAAFVSFTYFALAGMYLSSCPDSPEPSWERTLDEGPAGQ